MSRGIWAIVYEVAAENVETYLDWFHDIHIAEKLARDGYTSASHYKILHRTESGSEGIADRTGYIAIFGGDNSGVFLDPSPAQLKPGQSALTKEMIGMRLDSRAFILAQEWASTFDADEPRQPISEAALVLDAMDSSDDESFGSWCVQVYKPDAVAHDACVAKFLAATGPARHALIAGFSNSKSAFDFVSRKTSSPGTKTHEVGLSRIDGMPAVAERLWPVDE